MVRPLRGMSKMLVAAGLMVGFASLQPSCADNNTTLFIRQVQRPIAPDCSVKNDPNGTYLPKGLLDVGLTTHYFAALLLGSQLVARGDFKTARAEPNRINIEGADINLVQITENGETLVGFYQVVATGLIDPTTSGEASYGLAALEVIPNSVGLAIAGRLRTLGGGVVDAYEARIRVFGKTLGGTEVESNEYTFPIDACYGCTVAFPAESWEHSIVIGGDATIRNCLAKDTGAAASGSIACVSGQDGTTDCRTCQGTPVCTPCKDASQCPAGATCGAKGYCI
jgi:hypothetical protein